MPAVGQQLEDGIAYNASWSLRSSQRTIQDTRLRTISKLESFTPIRGTRDDEIRTWVGALGFRCESTFSPPYVTSEQRPFAGAKDDFKAIHADLHTPGNTFG
jgi:hypothetical protein